MPPTTLTFGCRLNTAESAVMQTRAREAGLSDAILVNTCAVTAEAVRQAKQAIRKARRENPGKTIVVTGCAAQIDPKTFAAMPEVDRVLGNAEKLTVEAYRGIGACNEQTPSDVVIAGLDPAIHSVTSEDNRHRDGMDARIKSGHDDSGWRLPNLPHAEVLREAEPRSTQPRRSSLSFTALRGNADDVGVAPQDEGALAVPPSDKILVGDVMALRETAAHLVDGFVSECATADRARAFVEVQNGCDHRCTFCIIPYGRGASRSVPMGAVVDQIKKLVARGVNEIVLTGVDITSYGGDLPGRPTLGKLVQKDPEACAGASAPQNSPRSIPSRRTKSSFARSRRKSG